jgi:hypothetical protein
MKFKPGQIVRVNKRGRNNGDLVKIESERNWTGVGYWVTFVKDGSLTAYLEDDLLDEGQWVIKILEKYNH